VPQRPDCAGVSGAFGPDVGGRASSRAVTRSVVLDYFDYGPDLSWTSRTTDREDAIPPSARDAFLRRNDHDGATTPFLALRLWLLTPCSRPLGLVDLLEVNRETRVSQDQGIDLQAIRYNVPDPLKMDGLPIQLILAGPTGGGND
jgi:hypothetical protein